MEQAINSLIGSLLSIYLPISDIGSRVAISLAISAIITGLIKSVGGLFIGSNFYDYFFNMGYVKVIINKDNDMHEKLFKYIHQKYIKSI